MRDLSQKLDKEIQLEIFGDDVELDRTLLEGLSDPLTHLVRNSVDHGIESPSARAAKGKKTFGTVRLSAAHLAGRVQIEVLDDGGGMDPERLKAKAIEKGIITTDQASPPIISQAPPRRSKYVIVEVENESLIAAKKSPLTNPEDGSVSPSLTTPS